MNRKSSTDSEGRIIAGWKNLCSDVIVSAVNDMRLTEKKCNTRKVWNRRSTAVRFLLKQTHPAFQWVNVDCEVLKEEVERIVEKNPSCLLLWE